MARVHISYKEDAFCAIEKTSCRFWATINKSRSCAALKNLGIETLQIDYISPTNPHLTRNSSTASITELES